MAAVAAILHVWALPAGAASEGTGREVSTHILIGLTPASSFSVSVESDELPSGPVVTDALGIATFTVDDASLPPGPLTVRVHPTGVLVITGVHVEDVGPTSAVVAWTTNRPADSRVEYGTTSSYEYGTPVDPILTTDHVVVLEGLETGTTYHYRALSSDGQGSDAQSADHSFETDPEPLAVLDVGILDVGTTSAVVAWTTNRESDSQVEYGGTAGYGWETPLLPAMVVDHVVTITGLTPGTLYHFRARSEGAAGGVAHSEDRTFVTDVDPPAISGLTVAETGVTWATIQWVTDRPASTLVAYGPTSVYGSIEDADQGFVIEHSITLSGLASGALYHFLAISIDEDGTIG